MGYLDGTLLRLLLPFCTLRNYSCSCRISAVVVSCTREEFPEIWQETPLLLPQIQKTIFRVSLLHPCACYCEIFSYTCCIHRDQCISKVTRAKNNADKNKTLQSEMEIQKTVPILIVYTTRVYDIITGRKQAL